MDSIPALKAKYDIKEMELNSLLEITQAINNNLPEESLYKIYNFTLRANLNIRKLALFVMDETWSCKVNYGTKTDFMQEVLPASLLETDKIKSLDDLPANSNFKEFELIVPIAHKNRKLAFVFVNSNKNNEGESVNTNFIQALSNIIIVAIENKKLARRQLEQEMIRRELEIASNVQQFLFPKQLPDQSILKAAAFYQPHHSIGGDYYDLIELGDDQFLFCIADVSGKGIPAALLMSNFQASLRTLVRQTNLLQEIITELNFQIMHNAEGQHFITFFVGFYDRSRSRLKYVNSGHNPPILIRNGKEPEFLEDGSTVLGAFKELPFLNVGIIEDLEAFLFCSYTDGLTEINNENGEEFGLERIMELVSKYRHLDPEVLNTKIIDDLKEFKGSNSYSDDITLFTCSVGKS
jgi:sigma-B regulation protein RsbU (phosphoserine phosphatase)